MGMKHEFKIRNRSEHKMRVITDLTGVLEYVLPFVSSDTGLLFKSGQVTQFSFLTEYKDQEVVKPQCKRRPLPLNNASTSPRSLTDIMGVFLFLSAVTYVSSDSTAGEV